MQEKLWNVFAIVAVILFIGYVSGGSHTTTQQAAVLPAYTTPTETPTPTPFQIPVEQEQETYQPVYNSATALCGDGTLSYSANHRGTCSHHGGVAEWY